jgi:hypothetical protein
MARIVSPVWSTIRGSISGTTYTTTPSGQIIARQRTKPVNPRTEWQSLVRSAMNEASSAWAEVCTTGGVNLQQWLAWADAMQEDPRAAFVKSYIRQYMLDRRGVLDGGLSSKAPQYVPAGSLEITNIPYAGAVGSTGVSLELTFNGQATANVTCHAACYISPGYPQTKFRYQGPWPASEAAGAELNRGANATVSFAGLVEGQKYFILVKYMFGDKTGDQWYYFQDMDVLTSDTAQTKEA